MAMQEVKRKRVVVLLVNDHEPSVARCVEKNQTNQKPHAKDEEKKPAGVG